jgi:aspartate kinase
MRIVQKYGGSSLADFDKLQIAAQRVSQLARQGTQVVVVVSAQGDTTDELIEKAKTVNPRGSAREMDAYLSAGEQLSASLMAMTLGAMGVPAVSLCGWQAGLLTDDVYGNARILGLKNDRILRELNKENVVVVAGFQGVSAGGDITTLGRGGSDTTAVALAAFLQADLCQIFTDVDGIYDRDPRRFPDAQRFSEISYEKMLRLIRNGAQVLHDRSVELARAYDLKIEVLSSATGAPGTIVGP